MTNRAEDLTLLCQYINPCIYNNAGVYILTQSFIAATGRYDLQF